MRRSLGLTLVLAFCAFGSIAAAPDTQRPAIELVVLDIEITGDLGGPGLAAEHEARLQAASAKLRESLSQTGIYRLVDTAPAQHLIDELKARHRYLHDCNGCDLDIGRQLGADRVLVTWVNRVSALILTLSYEIHDVKTGQVVARKSFSFRGDNDTAWSRAIDFMVRDLKESRTQAPSGAAAE